MNKEETNALQLLTGKTLLDEVSVEELQQLASDYPYFSIAQVLYCKKLQHEHHPETRQQAHKTALYFPNETWLRYLLLSTKEHTTETNTPLQTEVKQITEIAGSNDVKYNDSEIDDSVIIEPHESFFEKSSEPVLEENFLLNNEQTLPDDDGKITAIQNEITQPEIATEDIYSEPEEIPLDEDELAQQEEPLPIQESNQKIANLLLVQAEEFHKPVAPEQVVPIETEPYHTVDYFASQGIKLDAKKEDNGFDKKVHKFTDWLRQMKRINPQPADLGTNAEEETHIANIAASSNQTKEIVTESMAEVLLKQNKPEKALEIYEKLSLLYPSKNAYFAAKIQQLK